MGAIAPVLGTIMQVGSVLGTVASIAQPFIQDRADSRQQKQSNALQVQQMQQDAALQKEQNRVAAEGAEATRRAALKRAMARQRASFGAQGVGSSAGSAEAVLLGMFQELDEERANREKIQNLRAAALDQNVAQQQQINLLQQTQLRENQRIDYLSRL